MMSSRRGALQAIGHLLWATFERAVPRLSSALVMLAFARYTGAAQIGIYNWVALSYTLYLAVAENALRNQAVLSLRHGEDRAIIARRARQAGLSGAAVLTLVISALMVAYGHSMAGTVIALAPFAIVPLITSASILPVATLQYHDQWRTLARYQVLGTIPGVSLGVFVAVYFHSSAGMALNLIITEGVVLFMARRRAAPLRVPEVDQPLGTRGRLRSLTALATLGWTQGQLERVLIGGLSGVSALGFYSTAATIGRSPAEALSTASANYLRSRLAAAAGGADAHQREAEAIRRILTLAAAGAFALVMVVVALIKTVLSPLLGPTWDNSLSVAGLMAGATIAFVVQVGLQIVAVCRSQDRAALAPAMVGVCFALPIALLAGQSLVWAALAMIAKEITMLLLTWRLVNARGSGLPVASAVCLALVVVGFSL